MAKNLELNIIVRTIDEATETIKRIKRDAVRQVSGSGSGAERDALRGAREDMAAMRQANRARDQQFQQRVARRKREDKFDADQDALKARLYQEYLDDVAAMGKRHAAAERSRQVTVAKEAESQDALKARLYREFLADKAKMEERHAAESRRRRAKEAADTIRDANAQRARMQMYRFQMMDVAMSMRAISTEAFIIGGAMTAIGVGLARTSLEIGGILARFEAGTTVMLRSAERAKSLGAEVRQFIVRSPFKTAEGVEAARRAIAAGFSPDTLVQDLTSIGNVVGGTGGTDVTFANMTKELGKINNQQVLYLRNMTRLVNNSIPAWRLLLAGMNARGLKVTNEQLSVMVDRRLIPAKQAIRDILRGADVLFPGMMSRMLDVDPLAQWAVTFDHFILTLTNLTEPLRKWLLETLKAINAVLSQMPQNLRGIIPILFSLGVASNIVFGGMLLALSGILYMGQMVLLMFAAWPSIVGQLGLGTGAGIGAVLTAAKGRLATMAPGVALAMSGVGRKRAVVSAVEKAFSSTSQMAAMLHGTEEKAAVAALRESTMRRGVRAAEGRLRGNRYAAWTAKLEALQRRISEHRRAAASPGKEAVEILKAVNASTRLTKVVSVLARIAGVVSNVALIAMLTVAIVGDWGKMDEKTKFVLTTIGYIYGALLGVRVVLWLINKDLLGLALKHLLIVGALELVARNWTTVSRAIYRHGDAEQGFQSWIRWAIGIWAAIQAMRQFRAILAIIAKMGGMQVIIQRLLWAIAGLAGRFMVLSIAARALAAVLSAVFSSSVLPAVLGVTAAVTTLIGLVLLLRGLEIPIPGFGERRPGRRAATPEHRAIGGPVTAGKFYIVGENGPELLATNVNGHVFPRAQMRQTAASSLVSSGVGKMLQAAASSLVSFGAGKVPRMAAPSLVSFGVGKMPLSPSVFGGGGRGASSASLIGGMQRIAITAINARMPSVPANPSKGGLTTLFPFLNVGGFGNAVRAFQGGGSTDIYTEEEGDEIVIRVKRNSFGDMASAGRGLVFR